MKTYIEWLLYSVLLALSHFGLALAFLCVSRRKTPVSRLLRDGSLLFFATALTATCLRDYRSSLGTQSITSMLLFFFGLMIILASTFFYGGIVVGRLANVRKKYLSDTQISDVSLAWAAVAVFYGSALHFCFTS